MKCSKCGYRARTIGAMAKHYRKKHPGAMKARVHKVASVKQHREKMQAVSGYRFCPHCGGQL